MITCYSPVRRFTHTRRCFHARLACLIHAANVRSEPGSNPSLEIFLLRFVQFFENTPPPGLRASTHLQVLCSNHSTRVESPEQAWTHVFTHINEAVQNVKDRRRVARSLARIRIRSPRRAGSVSEIGLRVQAMGRENLQDVLPSIPRSPRRYASNGSKRGT